MESKRVVVTGLGAITPIGKTFPETWSNLCKGVNGVGEITRFDVSKFNTRFACEVKDYNPSDYFERKEARHLDLFSQFGIISAAEAIKNSGITPENTDFDDVCVIFSSGIGGITTLTNEVSEWAIGGDRTPTFSPFLIPKFLPDLTAGHISIRHGFKGANFAILSACASSMNAIVESFYFVKTGRSRVVVTGGSEAPLTETGVGGFGNMKAISTRNDDYMTASRPFDLNRDGFVMGEGSGALVIEELEHAKARGAKIYAEIIGAGLSADAYHQTSPHPEGIGAYMSMKRALADAAIEPEKVDLICAHGTSTPIGDTIECKAIVNLFGEHAPKLSISAIKSMIGHLLGGAGALGSISAIMSINDSIVPPTINHFTDDPNIDPRLDLTFGKAKKRNVDVALCNAFGFGGHNTSILFKKYEE